MKANKRRCCANVPAIKSALLRELVPLRAENKELKQELAEKTTEARVFFDDNNRLSQREKRLREALEKIIEVSKMRELTDLSYFMVKTAEHILGEEATDE